MSQPSLKSYAFYLFLKYNVSNILENKMVQNSGEDNHLVPLKNIGNVKYYSSKYVFSLLQETSIKKPLRM
jgi:hypothetical protein